MSRTRRPVTGLMLVMILLVSMFPAAPSAFGQEMVTGGVTGITVRAGGTWTHDPAYASTDGATDVLVFVSGNANFVVTSGVPNVDQVLAAIPAGSQFTDIDVVSSYALRYVTFNDVVYGLFSVVVGNSVQTIIAPSDNFAAAVDDAQVSILVDEAPVLSGVDGAALAGSFPVGAGSDVPLLGSGAPAAERAETSEATEAAAQPADTSSESTEALSVPGLEENAWVAQWSGLRISWSDDWQVKMRDGSPMISWQTQGPEFDGICLTQDQAVDERVCFTIRAPGDLDNPEGWESNYASPNSVSSFGTPYYGVQITESKLVYASTGVDGLNASLTQVEILDGYRVSTTVSGEAANLPGLAPQAGAGVQVNDRPVMDAVDADLFQTETDAMIAKLPELQAERDANLAALGLVDANHYVSVAMSCDIEWTAPLQLDQMSSLQPIELEESYSVEPPVNSEHFFLVVENDTDRQVVLETYCLQDLSAVESWQPWIEASGEFASDYVTVEGADVYYVINAYGGLSLLVKPIGGPAVMVSIYVGQEGFAPMKELLKPGVLLINGVDVFQAMEDDGVTAQLP